MFSGVAIDSSTLRISNCCQMTSVSNVTQNCEIGINKATLINPDAKEAIFRYTRVGSSVESQVWIVDTDYDHYLIANGCDRVNDDEEREIFWIFSRERELSMAEVRKIDDVLRANNFEKKRIIKQRHEVDLCKSKRPSAHRSKTH